MSDNATAPQRKHLCPLSDAERELSRQMKALQGQTKAPMQRARMSNLVIFCDSLEQSILINEQVPAIERAHPARVILLVGEPGVDRELTCRVTVRPVGEDARNHAVAEQVTLHAGGGFVERLPFAVRALLIGDLPVNLWWSAPVPPPWGGSLLTDLADLAQQIIYDSVGWREPARGVAATGGWLEQIERGGVRWRVASDLNWRRLKYWRRLLVESLGSLTLEQVAEAVHEVQLEHGPHAMVQAWMLGSWLAGRLGWKVRVGRTSSGKETGWHFREAGGGEGSLIIRRLDEGPPTVRRLRLVAKIAGAPIALCLEADSPVRLSMHVEGSDTQPRTVTVPPVTPIELIGRQLSDRERDPVFHESMATATVMAQSLLQ
jgi:glucose-6-phosphate dehydrogenase assembly protein OpcA